MSRKDDLDRQWAETGYEELGISFGAVPEGRPAQYKPRLNRRTLVVALAILATEAIVLCGVWGAYHLMM